MKPNKGSGPITTAEEINRDNANRYAGPPKPLPTLTPDQQSAVDALVREADAMTPPLPFADLRKLVKVHAEEIHVTESTALSADASKRARRPRPKQRPTHRSEFMAAMRAARKAHQSFAEFVEAVAAESVDALQIVEREGDEQWLIDCEAVDPPQKRVSRRTLESWWTQAGKMRR